ncbi:MAG: glycosyltransferase [Chthonomonadales bacterium]
MTPTGPPELRNLRILFYAVNGLGLGHVTRLLAIARKIRLAAPEAEIIFLTSSEAEDVIFREGFAAFKVPSKNMRIDGRIRTVTYSRLLHTVSVNTISAFHPHILIVDTFPSGSLQELLPVLRWDCRKVFIHREQRPDSASSDAMTAALQHYDLVVFPHEEDAIDHHVPDHVKQVWSGPITIRERPDAISRPEAREYLGLPLDKQVVYLTFGGGGDAELLVSIETAIRGILVVPDIHIALATGPLFRGKLSAGARISPVDHYPMSEMLSAFDCAISAAGYNTTMELMHFGVPTALVPFERQVDDQAKRARELADVGAAIVIDPLSESGCADAVSKLMNVELANRLSNNAKQVVPEGGSNRAAGAILRLLPNYNPDYSAAG